MNHARNWTREELPAGLTVALDLALDKKARSPAILRVTEIAGYTDWVLILSGRSERQVQAITENIRQGLRASGTTPLGTDGLEHHQWDLLDYDDFIIHVFYHPLRIRYDLESMWSDAPRVVLDLPAEIMDTADLDGLDAPELLPEYRGDRTFGGYVDEFEDDEWMDDAAGPTDDEA